MKYTDTKEYIDAVRFIEQMKVSRIPSFLGSYDSLLAQNMRIPVLSEFHRGLTVGKDEGIQEGFNIGLEKGLKEFIVNGDNQIFVDKNDGKIYTFSNNNQLLDSEKIGPILKDFTVNEHYKKRITKSTTFADNYFEEYLNPTTKVNNGEYIDFTDPYRSVLDFKKYNLEEKLGIIEKDLDARYDQILNNYKSLESNERKEYEINDIADENEKQIIELNAKINKINKIRGKSPQRVQIKLN